MTKKKKNASMNMSIISDNYGSRINPGNNSLYNGSIYDGSSVAGFTNMSLRSE
jgi:hypothetical protein